MPALASANQEPVDFVSEIPNAAFTVIYAPPRVMATLASVFGKRRTFDLRQFRQGFGNLFGGGLAGAGSAA